MFNFFPRHLFVFLIATLVFSCSTLKAPVAGPETLTLGNLDGKVDFHVSLPELPGLSDLFNQALAACLEQKWDQAADLLIEGDRLAALPGDKKSPFRQLLEKMWYPAFSSEKVLAYLTEQAAGNRDYFRGLRTALVSAPMTISWENGPAVLPWLSPSWFSLSEMAGFSLRFHPVVQVVVNGVPLRMILDTGAEVTFLYSDAAEKAGVRPLPDLVIDLHSSNDLQTKASVGRIDRMKLGSLEVHDALVWTSDRPFGSDSYDGMIGWPVLSRLVMEMDAVHKTLTLEPSRGVGLGPRNFIWIGEPLVLMTGGSSGTELIFYLDTGASRTMFTSGAISKLGINPIKDGPRAGGGVAGVQWQPQIRFERAEVFLDGKSLIYTDHRNAPIRFHTFAFWDGLLSSDIAQAGVVRLDFPAGKLTFETFPHPKE